MIVKYRTPLIDLLIFIDTNGNMAQLVEQLTVNQWVTGSSPVIPANMLVWLNGRAADL
jgi:hypothetical protein